MNVRTIIRAWKDENFRQSLTEDERAALPENPAGAAEISLADLGVVVGGATGEKCKPTNWSCGPTIDTTNANTCASPNACPHTLGTQTAVAFV